MTNRHGGGGRDKDDVFRDLYQRYYRRIVAYFMRVFRVSEEDAMELAQDTFVKFYETFGAYRGEAEWKYLEAIARSIGLNRVRTVLTCKRGCGVPVASIDDPDVAHHEKADIPDPVAKIHTSREIERLKRAISELATGQRQCVQLRLEDLSYEEIARALDISVDSVKSRLRDAKKQLRDKLGAGVELPEEKS